LGNSTVAAQPNARHQLGEWIEGTGPSRFIVALIVVNAAILGLQTSPEVTDATGPWLTIFNRAILAVFVLEIGIKIFASGSRFFRSGWNVFDFLVVGIALVPATGPLEVLRTLRILRVLRLLSQVQRLRQIVEALLRALPGIGWASFLLALVFYVFGVIGTELFRDEFPQWFGSLGGSLFSLFQVMTLESWSSGIARPVMETYPWAWAYFVPFILLASFMVLNLFIAIIVSATHSLQSDVDEVKREQTHEETMAELREIRARLDDLMVAAGRQREP
jgi:voltage-gated sodium channel